DGLIGVRGGRVALVELGLGLVGLLGGGQRAGVRGVIVVVDPGEITVEDVGDLCRRRVAGGRLAQRDRARRRAGGSRRRHRSGAGIGRGRRRGRRGRRRGRRGGGQ